MKKGSLILATAAVLLMLTGCQKEEFAEAPVYGDIYCSSSHPEVGDTVYLRVQIIYAGNRINSGAYNWKIRDPFSEITSITTRFIRICKLSVNNISNMKKFSPVQFSCSVVFDSW